MSTTYIRATQARATPAQRHAALDNALVNHSQLNILSHAFGLENLANLPPICQELARHMIVIAIDLEHWSENTDHTTEVGMCQLLSTAVRPITASGTLGDHGQKILETGRYYLYRLQENVHLPNSNFWARNVFGQERLVSAQEMQNILGRSLRQPITGVAGLEGCFCPVILLGHALNHDLTNLRDKTVSFDFAAQKMVAKYIDTQQLVRDAGTWTQVNNNIGLKKLVEELGFEHGPFDAHGAANDAGKTMICAVQIALNWMKAAPRSHAGSIRAKYRTTKNMKVVVSEIERNSRLDQNYHDIGGRTTYCSICGSLTHNIADCPNWLSQWCTHCEDKARDLPAPCYLDAAVTHRIVHCGFKAEDDAIARRARHAAARAANNSGGEGEGGGGGGGGWRGGGGGGAPPRGGGNTRGGGVPRGGGAPRGGGNPRGGGGTSGGSRGGGGG
jgi:hypothetical protein